MPDTYIPVGQPQFYDPQPVYIANSSAPPTNLETQTLLLKIERQRTELHSLNKAMARKNRKIAGLKKKLKRKK